MQALTRADLVVAHRNTVARDRVHVGVVGDITPEALGVLLDQILGDLPEIGAPIPPRAADAGMGTPRARTGIAIAPVGDARASGKTIRVTHRLGLSNLAVFSRGFSRPRAPRAARRTAARARVS